MILPAPIIRYMIVGLLTLGLGYYLAYKVYGQAKTETSETDHTKTTIITISDPKGNTKTVTTIDEKKTKETIAVAPKTKTNISILGANDFSQRLIKPLYGVSVTRELIGPVTIGVFGLTNGTVGLSLGLNF